MATEPAPAVSLQIDQRTIHDLVSGQLRAAVAMVFTEHSSKIINEMVRGVLDRKVDGKGEEPRYSQSTDKPLIHYLMGKAIQEAVDAEIREHVRLNAAAIRKQIAEQLKRKPGTIADALAASMVDALGSQWSFKIEANVTAQQQDKVR